jgi:hypothetical protein
MRFLAPVIEMATPAMFYPQHHLAFGGIGLELIRDDHPGHVLQAHEQFFEELLGRFLVVTTLHQDIEDVPALVDGTPEMVPFTGDREEHFGQVSLVPRLGPAATQLIGTGASRRVALRTP